MRRINQNADGTITIPPGIYPNTCIMEYNIDVVKNGQVISKKCSMPVSMRDMAMSRQIPIPDELRSIELGDKAQAATTPIVISKGDKRYSSYYN